MPAQFAKVDVTFFVNPDGILTVTAKEERSGVEAQVTVQPAHGLTQAEVDQLVNESIEHAEEDFTARRLIEWRNKAEGELRHTDKLLAQFGHQLTGEQRQGIAVASDTLKQAIAGDNLQRLQEAIGEFARATNPLATLVMNEVVRKALDGTEAEKLDAARL
jgi:molecular chaperone DnaK (HSP70)